MRAHGLFGLLLRRAHPTTVDGWGIRATSLPRGGLVAIDAYGGLVYDAKARADVHAWIWSIAHVLTHLGLGHVDPAHRDGRGSYTPEWRAACCVVVDRFLQALDLPGTPSPPPGLDGDEEELARLFAEAGIPTLLTAGPAGTGPDLWEDLFDGRRPRPPPRSDMWGRTFAIGLAAIDGSGAAEASLSPVRPWTPTEEIRALEPAPPSWDAPLAAWFDERFAVLSTRPTFGVVLDTAGTMDHSLLDRALGSIASTATARDVRRVRVVYCDDATRDAGWLPPGKIAHRLTARPRGTRLQPAVDLLLADPAFPPRSPLLLISDGRCDPVEVPREHAWLTSGHLPFTPAGPVFRL